MTALATAPLGLEFVKVEELHYGKLVASKHGPVPMGEGYTTTYCTSGFRHPDRVLPARLLDGVLLQPEHVEDAFREGGVFFFRLVDQDFVAMRARYRPEGGEGRPGRTYLQARIFQIEAPYGYGSLTPALFPWIEERKADPDPITQPASERIGVSAKNVPLESSTDKTRTDLEAKGPKQRVRIAAVIHAMRRAERVVLGDDSFENPRRRLDDFFEDVEFALTVMKQSGQVVSEHFRIACGLPPDLVGRALALSSVAPSTPQFGVTWDDVVQMIDPPLRRPRVPVGIMPTASANLPWLKSKPSSGKSNQVAQAREDDSQGVQETPSAKPLANAAPPHDVQRKDALAHEPMSITKPVNLLKDEWEVHRCFERNGVQNAEPLRAPASGRHLELLNEFGAIFEEARTKLSPDAFSRLFDFAADPGTHKGLMNWSPFDLATSTQANMALALLMGLSGRGDLLDQYTLVEFLYVCPHLEAMQSSSAENWIRRIIKCTDNRIREIGSLTSEEVEIIDHYNDHYLHADFSVDTKKIHVTNSIVRECRRASCTDNFPNTDGVFEDALRRMRLRYERADASSRKALIFCTSSTEPQIGSLFSLPPRNIIVQSSKILLQESIYAIQLLT